MASSKFSNQLYKQSESPLFELSTELRLQIYREWLVSSWTPTERVHLVLLWKRTDNGIPESHRHVRSSPCTLVPEALGEASTSRWLHNLNCFKGNNTGYTKEHTYEQSVRNISLVLACQRMYTEVLPFIYSTFIFDFPAFAIAAQFLDTFSFQTLNSIRNIHLTNNIPMHYMLDREDSESFDFTHWKDFKDWRLICETLRQMQHLRGVRIDFTGTIKDSRHEKELLQPLENVRVAPNGVFVVKLTTILEFGESYTEYESQPNLPFKIERKEWGRVGQYSEEMNNQPMVYPHLRRRQRRMILCLPIVYLMDVGQLIVDFVYGKLLNRPRRAFLSI